MSFRRRSRRLTVLSTSCGALMLHAAPGARAEGLSRGAHHHLADAAQHLLVRVERPSGALELGDNEIAIDTHVHTEYSYDSRARVEDVLDRAIRRGLSGIAITDHNNMDGYHRAESLLADWKKDGRAPAQFFLIPGEEISSADGHIIALFITTPVSSGQTAEETIQAIHAQHGLAVAAHPLFRRSLGELAGRLDFDAVERENGAEEAIFALAKRASRERREAFYAHIQRPFLGVSDAHDARLVGLCYTILPNCAPTLAGVRAALERGETVCCAAPPFARRVRSVGHGVSRITLSSVTWPNRTCAISPMLRITQRSYSVSIGMTRVGTGRTFGALIRRRF